jgi:hypothetical protein
VSALRTRYRLGRGFVELLEPDGTGPVARAVSRWGGHLFAAGASVADVSAASARIRARGVEPRLESGQIHLDPESTGGRGLRLVISRDEPCPAVGAVSGFYEVTNLVHDVTPACERLADLFGLDADAFVPIASREFGYDGTLTLFDPDRLDRFEAITPRVPDNTMGRFFAKRGESLYMAFAESAELANIEVRLRECGAGFTAVPPEAQRDRRGAHTLFLHPPVLGGMMLGLSRPNHAWTWSGSPERAGEGA